MKISIQSNLLFSTILVFLFSSVVNSQENNLIKPPSLNHEFKYEQLETHYLPHTNMDIAEAQNHKEELPMWAGFSLKTEIYPSSEGSIIQWPNGQTSWMLRLVSPGAPALGLVIEETRIPNGAKIFIYSEYDPNFVYAITGEDVSSGYISTPHLPYESIIIEYTETDLSIENGMQGSFIITDLVVLYNTMDEAFKTKDLGDSQACMLNINCSPEGDNWQLHKRGIARMIFRVGSSWYYCTGTLINNTNQDGTPYFLTADHCGGSASAADRNVWQFYFNYERPSCANTGTPPYNLRTGCVLKARGQLSGGSDFQLIQLNSAPPQEWNPYYNGWDKNNTATTGGVGIHHPAGDAKKISTFSGTTTSATPVISGQQMASNSAWRVTWSPTANGHSVTEGGSSGSPLFNNAGLVVGTLTGGSSYCSSPYNPDFYGKLSYHWLSNGTTDAQRLEPWLDPANTGATFLPGFDPFGGINPNFISDKTVAFIGEDIVFTDLSTGDGITSWSWDFGEGAEPATATGQGPHTVNYNTIGYKTVSLTVNGEETEIKADYIFIKEPSNTVLLYEQQPNIASGGAATSTNTGAINYEVADNYLNLTGLVERVVVHGIYAFHDGSAWNTCEPEANINFNVNFYEPSTVQPEWDNPVYEFTAGSEVSVFGTWGNWTVYEWDIELPGQAAIDGDGWVSVQAYNSTCWFLWFKSNDADSYAYQVTHTKNITPEFAGLNGEQTKDALSYDLAFQLWAAISPASIISFDFEEDVLVDVDISPIVGGESTISVVVSYGTDISSLTPTITIYEGASIFPEPVGGEYEAMDFSVPQTFVVTAEDGIIQTTYSVIVTEEPPTYSVTFVIIDENEEPLSGAVITLNDVENEANDYLFEDLLAGTYNYSVDLEGYFSAYGSVTITDQDVTETVTLDEIPTYTVTFIVLDEEENELSGATITLGDVTNDPNNYVFEGILAGTYEYSVGLTGYVDASGSVNVDEEDITVAVILDLETITYTVTFNIIDKYSIPLSGAVITLGDITNEPDDYVFIVEAGNYDYIVSLVGYNDVSDQITVDDHDLIETVVMTPTKVDINRFNNLSVFPNPFSDFISITSVQKINRIVITNLIGVEVKSLEVKQHEVVTVNTNELPNGIFIIKLYFDNEEMIVRKVIKN